jgi:hypothetical protein
VRRVDQHLVAVVGGVERVLRTDVMILKKLAKMLAFFAQITACEM